jgi:hypothetical protein
MKKFVLLAALAVALALGAALTLTATPQTTIAGPCDKNGCCSGMC